MKQRTGDIEPSVQDDELGPGLLHALAHARLGLLVSCQPLLQDLSKPLVQPTLSTFCVYSKFVRCIRKFMLTLCI